MLRRTSKLDPISPDHKPLTARPTSTLATSATMIAACRACHRQFSTCALETPRCRCDLGHQESDADEVSRQLQPVIARYPLPFDHTCRQVISNVLPRNLKGEPEAMPPFVFRNKAGAVAETLPRPHSSYQARSRQQEASRQIRDVNE